MNTFLIVLAVVLVWLLGYFNECKAEGSKFCSRKTLTLMFLWPIFMHFRADNYLKESQFELAIKEATIKEHERQFQVAKELGSEHGLRWLQEMPFNDRMKLVEETVRRKADVELSYRGVSKSEYIRMAERGDKF